MITNKKKRKNFQFDVSFLVVRWFRDKTLCIKKKPYQNPIKGLLIWLYIYKCFA